MKRPANELIARLAVVANFLLVLNLIMAWVFVQFVHYHAQSTVLSPADYTFDLATKEEYRALADPAIREVTYSDGRQLIKSAAWDELRMASYYAPTPDGNFYVRVTSLGTALMARRWTESMILVLMFALPALALSIWNHVNVVRSTQPAEASASVAG